MILKIGSTGQEVAALQLALSNNGVPCDIDGKFGPKTLLAVTDLQEKAGLFMDGIAGPQTLKFLGISSAEEPTPTNFKPYSLVWYAEMFRTMKFDDGYESQIAGAAHRVLAGKDRYEALVKNFFPKMPWFFVGVTHNMECSCNWRGVLHNGELIVGTNRKTKLVPAGHGPFATWEDAAVDALQIEGMDKIQDWSIGNILRMGELFNGTGYQRRSENTPYLWAMTSVNDGTGKYVADGKLRSQCQCEHTSRRSRDSQVALCQ
jgi:lysozyme family protein